MAAGGPYTAGKVDDLKVYYCESTQVAGSTILRYELLDRIRPYCMFISPVERALIKMGMEDGGRKVVNYVPSNFSQFPRVLTEHVGIDTFLVTVSPMDRHGYFSFGTGNDYSSKVARAARHLFVEVNEHMPRVYGSPSAIARLGSRSHHRKPRTAPRTAGPAIGTGVCGYRQDDCRDEPDGACLQMGVGALPNLVCSQLHGRKDLGIHTEALCPGMIDLIDAGVVTNRRKRLNPGKTVYTFAMGQKAMYDFLDDNPSVESHPVDYVNDPNVIAQNDNVVSINAALQIDLTGAVNAEHLLGHQYSATGGQLDFVRGAYASRGGKSIIACHSTAARGKASRIVARLDGPVTTPRIDTHILMTEFGWTDLKGASPRRSAPLR